MKTTALALALVAVALAGCTCNETQVVRAVDVPAAAPCDPPPMAAAAPCPESPDPVSLCGGPPPAAVPGEVWCCVAVETPAPMARVCTQPEHCERIEIPAVYESFTEQVLVCPARTEWQRVDCTPAEVGAGKIECYRLVEIPAQYNTVEKQRLVQAASFRMQRTPAVFEMVPQGAPQVTYRWQRFRDCEVPEGAIPARDVPPTGGFLDN